jgi:hypothetical protein
MTILSFLLQIIALICLFCAALGVPVSRVSLGWLGMALWLLSLMVSGVVLHPVIR